MAKSKNPWLKGCGIGCGAAIVLIILLTVSGSFLMMKPFRDAIEMRETVDGRLGDVNDFTPWPDGGIPPDRLEAFLNVRRAVQEVCKEIATAEAGIEALDRLDDEGEPETMEILGAFGEASKSVFGMLPKIGRFFHARNAALLEAEMSLGEYTYIYVLAYGPAIAPPETDEEAGHGHARTRAHFSRRARETLRQQLRNRLAAMDEQPGEWADSEERRLLVEEIASLEEHPERLPWCTVRPPALEASLAPYEEQIAELFCPGATHYELVRNESSGLGIHGD